MSNEMKFTLTIHPSTPGYSCELEDANDLFAFPVAYGNGATADKAVLDLLSQVTFDDTKWSK